MEKGGIGTFSLCARGLLPGYYFVQGWHFLVSTSVSHKIISSRGTHRGSLKGHD